MLKHDNPEESRYDQATTEKIIRIASRLDSESRENLTVAEIEQIAKEVGIEASYVREALRRLADERVEGKLGRKDRPVKAAQAQGHSKAEFWSTVVAFLIPLIYASVAFFVSGGDVTTGKFFTMMAPLPLALIVGFIAGNKKVGFFASLVLVLALWPALDRVMATEQRLMRRTDAPISIDGDSILINPMEAEKLQDWGERFGAQMEVRTLSGEISTLERELETPGLSAEKKQKIQGQIDGAKKKLEDAQRRLESLPQGEAAPLPPTPPGSVVSINNRQNSNDDLPPLIIFGALFAGILGAVGAGVRQRHFPFAGHPAQSAPGAAGGRDQLLEQYFELQSKLQGQKRKLAFLSVDVSDSTGMKHGQEELLVEHSFSRYTKWVAEVAAQYGGQVQAAAGDGVMCAFPTEDAAVSAAIALQRRIGEFNEQHNRLPVPFRIRCGVSSGEVPWEEGTPIGLLQSPVIDRAAQMQKMAAPETIVFSQEIVEAAQTHTGPLESTGFAATWHARTEG